MLAAGWTGADHWPVMRVWTEVGLTREREQARLRNDALLLHAAVGAVAAGAVGDTGASRRGHKAFNDLLDKLT